MSFKNYSYVSDGKTTYWVRGQRFFNDSGLRNGKQRAIDYCHANFINESEIITFDSILECERYEFLVELQKQGKISDLQHHLVLPILQAYKNHNGDEIPALNFNSDFTYLECETGKRIVEDVKGMSLISDSRFEAVKQIFDYVYREKTYIRIIIKRDGNWLEWKMGEPKKKSKLIKKQAAQIKELKKQAHEKEMQENLEKREKARIIELRTKPKLDSTERKRLAFLEEKYAIK